jgi:hypothetical protein
MTLLQPHLEPAQQVTSTACSFEPRQFRVAAKNGADDFVTLRSPTSGAFLSQVQSWIRMIGVVTHCYSREQFHQPDGRADLATHRAFWGEEAEQSPEI